MRSIRRLALGMTVVVLLVLAIAVSGCVSTGTVSNQRNEADVASSTDTSGGEGVATIYLAGGCFWGVEKYLASVRGVMNAESGYANGITDSPTYRDVSSGRSGYTETVRVDYDPTVAPLPFLLDLYYEVVDPTSLNRQGNDRGTQYRTGIYYSDPADREVVEASLDRLQKRYNRPVVIEAEPLKNYTPAEEYHQDYLDKNPGGYCHINPDLFKQAAEAVPDPSLLTTASGEAE
ncbi:MAG: peptide-methionine (S)-S-oxide reductase MsrA [Coriobacteriia bacterium]|nr:peptide-methionine (S)-S-oxide reductase MsrA [Coriobacteriia bacterium]